MYICVCNAITESAVQRAADARPRTIAELYRALGAHPTCGKCVPMVRNIARGADLPALTTPDVRG